MSRREKIELIKALQTGEKSLDEVFYSPVVIQRKDGTYESNGRIITEARMKTLSFPEVIILPENGREEID